MPFDDDLDDIFADLAHDQKEEDSSSGGSRSRGGVGVEYSSEIEAILASVPEPPKQVREIYERLNDENWPPPPPPEMDEEVEALLRLAFPDEEEGDSGKQVDSSVPLDLRGGATDDDDVDDEGAAPFLELRLRPSAGALAGMQGSSAASLEALVASLWWFDLSSNTPVSPLRLGTADMERLAAGHLLGASGPLVSLLLGISPPASLLRSSKAATATASNTTTSGEENETSEDGVEEMEKEDDSSIDEDTFLAAALDCSAAHRGALTAVLGRLHVIARATPQVKEAVVRALQQPLSTSRKGNRGGGGGGGGGGGAVLYCGDGSNDVGALREALTGVAFGTAGEDEVRRRRIHARIKQRKRRRRRRQRERRSDGSSEPETGDFMEEFGGFGRGAAEGGGQGQESGAARLRRKVLWRREGSVRTRSRRRRRSSPRPSGRRRRRWRRSWRASTPTARASKPQQQQQQQQQQQRRRRRKR